MSDIGLAHLSLLHLEPDELVRVAAAAGYDFVGIRVRGATPAERIADLSPGSSMSRAVLAALDETGLRVEDIEFLALDGNVGRETWMPMLEAGAALGARSLTVAGVDPDEARLTAALSELVGDARGFGILPAIEPISYNAVSSVSHATRIARAAGAGVLLDPLHLRRADTPADVLAELAAAPDSATIVRMLQLCDAPFATPEALVIDGPLPRGMTADGEPRKVESRALRLPPGEGDLPLAEMLALFADRPVGLEVPNGPLAVRLGDVGYARLLHERTRELIVGAA
ncbi:sugar phosphate isomerase/epimerase family protein [Leucobacter tenebrionis]|uniref:sugar phosphate isomerase/epimerase family protein n=1 Tax=Leucobacter tenebrionis TaxID=2873270 RepID=UPI001CA60A67|nr:TIM barrel protein [Leucobacter tenebrionis]QZY51062.1 sugar phosphate isomerase/epimerase [Leucobacter tenebrionis]